MQEFTMQLSNLKSALVLGAAIFTLSVGGAFAATTLDTSVDVLAGPGSHYKPIAKLQAGQTVKVTREASDWCRVSTGRATGWVNCSDINGLVRKAPAPAAAPAISAPDWTSDQVLNTLHENDTQNHTFG